MHAGNHWYAVSKRRQVHGQGQHLWLRSWEAAEAPLPFSTSPGAAIRIFCAFDQRSYIPVLLFSPLTCFMRTTIVLQIHAGSIHSVVAV